MLSEDTLENLVQPFVDRQESVNLFIIEKIATNLKEIGELSTSDLKQLRQLVHLGADMREINKEISRISNIQVSEIKKAIKLVAQDSYSDTKGFYDYRHKSYIPFSKNEKLQTLVRIIGNQTAKSYVNLSNSKATGYLMQDNGRLKFHTIDQTYEKIIDEAIQLAHNGVDIRTATTRAINQLLSSGLRRMYWDSGYTQRLDTAVRRNIYEGVRAIDQGIQDEAGKQFNADGKELSAHFMSAPDHEPFQGHVFTNEEFNKLQSNEDFKDVDGKKFSAVDRIIGIWNCRHIAYSVILDGYRPRYSKDELEKFIKDNHDGYTLPSGEHLTLYQCTQKQREMETKIRYAKEKQLAMRELGNKEAEIKARQLVVKLTSDYKKFSKDCKLPIKKDRITIPNYSKI